MRPIITSCLNPLPAIPAADRILVLRLGALGDVARTLPCLVALRSRYPGAHIAWLVEPKAAGILAGHPALDEILVFPRDTLDAGLSERRPGVVLRELRRFARTLRRGRYDLVIDFHSILKSGVLSWLSGAPVRVGYAAPVAREGAWLFANRRARLTPGARSRFERNGALLRFLGIDPELRGELRPLPLAERSGLQLESALGSAAAHASAAPLVAIHPGTSEATPYKRYTSAGYGEVARSLADSAGARCIVTFGPSAGDREIAADVVEAAAGAAELAPETPRVQDLAALFARCRLFVGSDSGPLHIASLVGTPAVQILGPTHPIENAPYAGSRWRQVRVPLPCSPCRRGCAAATCMRLVPAERVTEASLELLAESKPAGDSPVRPERSRDAVR